MLSLLNDINVISGRCQGGCWEIEGGSTRWWSEGLGWNFLSFLLNIFSIVDIYCHSTMLISHWCQRMDSDCWPLRPWGGPRSDAIICVGAYSVGAYSGHCPQCWGCQQWRCQQLHPLHLQSENPHSPFFALAIGRGPQHELPPGVVKFVPPRRGLNWNSTEKIWENGEINALGSCGPVSLVRSDSPARMSTMCARG